MPKDGMLEQRMITLTRRDLEQRQVAHRLTRRDLEQRQVARSLTPKG